MATDGVPFMRWSNTKKRVCLHRSLGGCCLWAIKRKRFWTNARLGGESDRGFESAVRSVTDGLPNVDAHKYESRGRFIQFSALTNTWKIRNEIRFKAAWQVVVMIAMFFRVELGFFGKKPQVHGQIFWKKGIHTSRAELKKSAPDALRSASISRRYVIFTQFCTRVKKHRIRT
jgi:hypothetical protein